VGKEDSEEGGSDGYNGSFHRLHIALRWETEAAHELPGLVVPAVAHSATYLVQRAPGTVAVGALDEAAPAAAAAATSGDNSEGGRRKGRRRRWRLLHGQIPAARAHCREVKTPSGKLTKLQENTITRIKNAKGQAFKVTSAAEVAAILKQLEVDPDE